MRCTIHNVAWTTPYPPVDEAARHGLVYCCKCSADVDKPNGLFCPNCSSLLQVAPVNAPEWEQGDFPKLPER